MAKIIGLEIPKHRWKPKEGYLEYPPYKKSFRVRDWKVSNLEKPS